MKMMRQNVIPNQHRSQDIIMSSWTPSFLITLQYRILITPRLLLQSTQLEFHTRPLYWQS